MRPTVAALSISLSAVWLVFPAPLLKGEPASRYASFKSGKVHYYDVGTGNDALFFVHGWACDATFWREQYHAFPNRRVLALDLPGHGRSGKPQTAYTMELFARAIDAVLQDAKVERAIIIGHSMGAPVGREFYRIFPEKTTALVIIDGALRRMFSSEQAQRLQEQLRSDYPATARRMVDGMLMPVRDASLRHQVREVMLATPGHVAVSAMQAMTNEASYHGDPIKVPLLAVLAKSPFWAPDTEQFLRSLAPDLEFHMMEDVSHFLMLEKPDELNTLIRDFIARREPRQLPSP